MALGAKRKASQTTRLQSSKLEKERAGAAVVRADPSPCPICQEPVGQWTAEGIIEKWSQLPCGHRFGSHCIKMWLGMAVPGDYSRRPVCPVCRGPASHACGHPVLPTDATLDDDVWGGQQDAAAAAADDDDDNEPEDVVARRQTACELAQRTACGYCVGARHVHAHTRWPTARRKRRLWPWRLVKGCWRLVLYAGPVAWRGRRHPHEMTYVIPWQPDEEWEEWWKAQDPTGV